MSSKKNTTDEEMEEGVLDDDTTDSLEIKPPQAQRMEKKHKKKEVKEKRHDKNYRPERGSDDRYPPQDRQKYYDQREQYHHQSRNQSRYTEQFQHPARPGRDQGRDHHQRYEQGSDVRYRGHSAPDYYKSSNQKRGYDSRSHGGHYERRYERSGQPSSQPQSTHQQVQRSPTPEEESDKLLNDLRQKLLMKKKKHDEEMAQRDDGEGHKKHKKRKKHRHQGDDNEEQESAEVIDVEEHSRKRPEVESPEDEETVARRAKLLKADREMARRKEELEARREQRRDKTESAEESPPASGKKKRKELVSESPRKRIKNDDKEQNFEDVVMVSDHSVEDENESETETDSESDSDSNHSDEEDVSEHERPVSPPSDGEIAKQERRRNSRSRSVSNHDRHRSASVSSSGSEDFQSRSEHSKSRSRSRSHRRSRTRSHSGGRSRSRSPSRSRSRDRNRSKSKSRRHSRSSFEMSSDESGKPTTKRPKSPKSPKSPKKNSGGEENDEKKESKPKLPYYYPAIQGCRSVEEFQCLNRIEEGTYGVVYRAKDKRTEEIVALKRLKMEKEKEGFPITSLREINTLLKGQHPNIVTVREIVVGSNMDKIFIVMDYVEHDLKSLMETMKHKKQVFLPGEVKCLMQQLLRAVGHLHDNWILHRDLKTSNLLLSHKGILKVGDFGLAREYGSPLKPYTPIVVTLWYRAPELLLGCKEYSTPIDIWSVGCIFAEFLQMTALFTGKSEVDQLNRIFKELGTPNEKIWPGYKELPAVQKMTFTEYPVSNLRKRFSKFTSELGIALIQGLLTYDPKQRYSAEKALKSNYFEELPMPIDPAMFPTWPAKSELGLKKALASSPKPPSGGGEFKRLGDDPNDPGFQLAGVSYAESRQLQMGPGFSLKF